MDVMKIVINNEQCKNKTRTAHALCEDLKKVGITSFYETDLLQREHIDSEQIDRSEEWYQMLLARELIDQSVGQGEQAYAVIFCAGSMFTIQKPYQRSL